MGDIWIKNFAGGLDTRRMPETSEGGILIVGSDGHINRGAEFEQRAAFVKAYTLPAGQTKSLATGANGIYAFGDGAAPIMPVGVGYQRLQHPDGSTALYRVLATDLYAGKLYAIAQFVDGTIYHYYDGVRVADMTDGRAHASFRVTGGGIAPAVQAVGSFEIIGGVVGDTIDTVVIDGAPAMNGAVTHTGDNATTAQAVAAAINSFTSNPDYTATTAGRVVQIHSVVAGTAPNGRAVVITTTGAVNATNAQNLSGGVDEVPSKLLTLTVNGVSIIGGVVQWAKSNAYTAALVASAINSFLSTPDYTAVAVGDRVNILAAAGSGTTPNGYAVAYAVQDGLVITAGGNLSGGAALSNTPYQTGTFCRTIGSKMYLLQGPYLHFSGVGQPTKFDSGTTGAGFIDMSTLASGLENLKGIAEYQNASAVFGEASTVIEALDPDPTKNARLQTLRNTGSVSSRGLTQFGDTDLLYLDVNGVRSLRARQTTNSASVADLGVPIDTIVVAKLLELLPEEREQAIGIIEPLDKRFWLALKDIVYVFSYFESAKVSAWSTYTPSYIDENGVTQTFTIEDLVVFRRKVFLRSGDTVFAYGGLTDTLAYDATEPQAWLPYLDAGTPAAKKTLTGLDVACEGTWEVRAAMEPKNKAASDKMCVVDSTTFNGPRLPAQGEATHFSLRFIGKGVGPRKISSAVIHFEQEAATTDGD